MRPTLHSGGIAPITIVIMRLSAREVIARPRLPALTDGRRRKSRSPEGRWLAATLAAILMIPGAGHALGLGRAIGEAVLGESLLIEIPVTGTIDRPIDSSCVSVQRMPDSLDPEYFPRDLAVRIDRIAGAPRLVVTTRSAIRQPLVEFRISVACGYNLSHDYLLMASPRREAPPVPEATATPATAAVPAAAGAAAAAEPGIAREPAADGRLPDGLPGRKIVLDRDMTLEALAKKHFPGPLRQGRFMRWVAEANPQIFAGSKQLRGHRLPAGTELTIPVGVPPRRPGDYQNGLSPLGEPMSPEELAAATGTAPRRASAASEGEPARALRSAPADGSRDRLVVGNGGGAKRDEKETIALVDRLTGMMEQQVSAQSANDEKIRELEAATEELKKTIARLQKEAAEREARWQAERAAEKAARDSEDQQGWWHLLLAVVAGGILGAGALLGLRTLRTRRQAELAADEDFTASAASPVGAGDRPSGSPSPAAVANAIPPVANTSPSDHAPPPSRASKPKEAEPAEDVLSSVFSDTALDERRKKPKAPLPSIDFEPPRPELPPAEPVPTDPATAAIELANIMTSMGLGQSAAQTLVEHIRENPRQSLQQWLKLLEIHRLNGNREEFEKHAGEVRLHFNVQPDDWNTPGTARASLEDYPHIRSRLVKLWRTPEAAPFLQTLLMDNRDGTRSGFPQAVAEEILLLIAITASDGA